VKSTARKGNPSEASRGAAVDRARRLLGDALDERLRLEQQSVEEWELDTLATLTGIDRSQLRERLAVATLEELETWTALVRGQTLFARAG
jgi:hypothetical protein